MTEKRLKSYEEQLELKNKSQNEQRNTLMLGNGFSRNIFKNMPSWESLFEDVEQFNEKNISYWKKMFKNGKNPIKNYTILYEVNLLKDKTQDDSKFKQKLISKIKEAHSACNINDSISKLNKFGKYLVDNNVHDIITTNYDNGIETILCKKCGYKELETKGLVKEDIYNIRTYKEYRNDEMKHSIKLWKIHGDVDRIKSITLGFDQYCGSLAKLSAYIKGTYKSHHENGPTCEKKMHDKCVEQTFDNLSWAELFFNTNVYIVGLGLDFSEIDIWWLLNKHMRIKKEVSQVTNNIYYLYDKVFDDKKSKKQIFEALEAFQVECRGIKSGRNYIKNIFKEINQSIVSD